MFKTIRTLLVLCLLAPLAAWAAEPYQEGKQYIRLDTPVSTLDSDKVEVAEAFWYGCPHCYSLEPAIEAWKKTLPDYANFRKVPAQFRKTWKDHGQLFFTIDALKLAPSVHEDVFSAIHNQKRGLTSTGDMAKFLEQYGVTDAQFNKAYKSFGVKNQLRKADAVVRGSKISGVPALIINGKYTVSAGTAGSNAEMLKVAQYLMEKERKLQAAN